MNTFNMNQNYYLRKCYLERNQVPTQKVMKEKMTPSLAAVCFNSLTPKLKVLAGLEPPLKGGGAVWFNPPQDLLQSKAVLKPIKKELKGKLNWNSVDEIGMELMQGHRNRFHAKRKEIMYKLSDDWNVILTQTINKTREDVTASAAKSNTEHISEVFNEFCSLYKTNINKVQDVLLNAAVESIQRCREEIQNTMQQSYEHLLRKQVATLHDDYNNNIINTKAQCKKMLVEGIRKNHIYLTEKLHDINLEKHIAIEKSRRFLECQKLACQVYVAIKEKENTVKEIRLSEVKNAKETSKLSKSIACAKAHIKNAKVEEEYQQQLSKEWQKNISHVVKGLQRLVSYCLNTVPDHADFFIDMERLMLLQLNEALQNPKAESIMKEEVDVEADLVAKPKPFYLFCDKGHTAVNADLCPKHVTSSASQMPVIVINKQCVYAACDNFEQFNDKIKDYAHGGLEDDVDIEDDHDYTGDLNVTYTPSQQLRELKLESSIMQILQQEITNLKNVPYESSACKLPYCSCCNDTDSTGVLALIIDTPTTSVCAADKITKVGQLVHKKEHKDDSYLSYVQPKKCNCHKLAKKHLTENLPPYMRNHEAKAPELPNYVKCTSAELKKLVKNACSIKDTGPSPQYVEPKTVEKQSQTCDREFDYLCNCFSVQGIKKCIRKDSNSIEARNKVSIDRFNVVDGAVSSSFLSKDWNTFASERAHSLLRLIEHAPEIKELFKNKHADGTSN